MIVISYYSLLITENSFFILIKIINIYYYQIVLYQSPIAQEFTKENLKFE